jgi:hypothetical protein
MSRVLSRVSSWAAAAVHGGCAAAAQRTWRAPGPVGSLLSGAAQQRMPWGVPATAAAAWGSRALSGPPPPEAKVEPEYDPELLRALQIDHIPPARIADALRSENITIEQLKMLVDEGFHQSPGGANLAMSAAEQAAMSRDASEWSLDLVHQLNPRRRFFPGQTYLPEELSPNYQVDYSKLREDQRKLGCPLGGKKGPKLNFTNVATLSRYIPAAPAAPFPAARSRVKPSVRAVVHLGNANLGCVTDS